METKIWEIQPEETAKSFSAFCIYRDFGKERTLEKVQEKLRKNSGYLRVLYNWSSKHKWVERVKAYDVYLDEIRRQETERRIKQEGISIGESFIALHNIAKAALNEATKALLEKDPNNPKKKKFNLQNKQEQIDIYKLNVLVDSLGSIQKALNLSEGKPTEITKQTGELTINDKKGLFERIEEKADVFRKLGRSNAKSDISDNDS